MVIDNGAVTAAGADDRLIVRLATDIDCATAETLCSRMAAMIAAYAPRQVIIDLARVDFCDSAGIRGLETLAEEVTRGGATFRLEGARPHIVWLVQSLGATRLLAARP